MNIAFALLADYTTTSKDDKFSVLGIYDRIYARQFPAKHRELQLAMRLQTTRADLGSDRKIMVELVDGEGRSIQSAEGTISLPRDLDRPPSMNLVMVFEDTNFPHAGSYQFTVMIDGRVEAEVPLTLELMPEDYQA